MELMLFLASVVTLILHCFGALNCDLYVNGIMFIM